MSTGASSGRCHGPGCTQTAVVEGGWCSERCFGVWQWAKARREVAHLAPMDEIHVWGPAEIKAAERLTRPEWQPTLAKAELLVSTSVTSPQVAPENPQVASIPDPARGWLARVLDRLFGRTT